MTEVHLGNTRRKIRALLAKTTATSGCTAGEKTSALKMAKDIAAKHLPSTDAVLMEIASAERDMQGDVPPTVKEAKAAAKKASAKGDKPKKATRAETIITMMSRKEGVSIAELQDIFKTEAHTVRAQISVESRKAGFKPTLKDGRYYRTAPQA
jgi:hypothetical protein